MDCRNTHTNERCMILQTMLFCLFITGIGTRILGETSRKTTISVYGLKSIGISQSLATSLQEHLESNLLNYEQYDVMSRNDIDLILKESRFMQTGIASEEESAIAAGHILGVDKIITGTISLVGSTYNIVLKMIDVGTAKLESSVNQKSTGNADTLLYVIENSLHMLIVKRNEQVQIRDDMEKMKSELAEYKTREQKLQQTCDLEKARAESLRAERIQLEGKNRELEMEKIEFDAMRAPEAPQKAFKQTAPESEYEDSLDERSYDSVLKNYSSEHTKKMSKRIGIGAATIFSVIGISVLLFQLSGNK